MYMITINQMCTRPVRCSGIVEVKAEPLSYKCDHYEITVVCWRIYYLDINLSKNNYNEVIYI
jgi:hypothetical protein